MLLLNERRAQSSMYSGQIIYIEIRESLCIRTLLVFFQSIVELYRVLVDSYS